jgi:hypothetical protein
MNTSNLSYGFNYYLNYPPVGFPAVKLTRIPHTTSHLLIAETEGYDVGYFTDLVVRHGGSNGARVTGLSVLPPGRINMVSVAGNVNSHTVGYYCYGWSTNKVLTTIPWNINLSSQPIFPPFD